MRFVGFAWFLLIPLTLMFNLVVQHYASKRDRVSDEVIRRVDRMLSVWAQTWGMDSLVVRNLLIAAMESRAEAAVIYEEERMSKKVFVIVAVFLVALGVHWLSTAESFRASTRDLAAVQTSVKAIQMGRDEDRAAAQQLRVELEDLRKVTVERLDGLEGRRVPVDREPQWLKNRFDAYDRKFSALEAARYKALK